MDFTLINLIDKKQFSEKIILHGVDINKTVLDLKELIINQLNLNSKISINRLGISYEYTKEGKQYKETIPDDYKQLMFYNNLAYPNTILYIKDIGPQVNYRLVYIVEYLGPLILSTLFFINLVIKLRAQNKKIPFIQVVYFGLSFFHFSKRIIESIFVHIFSRTTMPLRNLIKNCIYYWGLFGLLCNWSLFKINHGDIEHFVVLRYFFVLFFFSAELQNLKCHMILRDIKIRGKGKKYMPPRINGFELVTCANYYYEFLSWFCFSIISMKLSVFLFTVCGFIQMKEWALKKHEKMKEIYGEKYPDSIKAFIPYMI